MEVYERIAEQIDGLRLPLFAVSLTALPRANTPVLLMLHWHGFRADGATTRGSHEPPGRLPVPGSTLQLNADWHAMERLDEAVLEAAWRLGAWQLDREERRGCNTAGASEREALECRQAFGDSPFEGEPAVLSEAPDRQEMMQVSARIGYVRWQFRPVRGSLWQSTALDDSLSADGSRNPPCPVRAKGHVGTRVSRVRYRLGRNDRLILPESARGA